MLCKKNEHWKMVQSSFFIAISLSSSRRQGIGFAAGKRMPTWNRQDRCGVPKKKISNERWR